MQLSKNIFVLNNIFMINFHCSYFRINRTSIYDVFFYNNLFLVSSSVGYSCETFLIMIKGYRYGNSKYLRLVEVEIFEIWKD